MADDQRTVHPEHWTAIARHTPLGVLCDLDGTLVPFASSPEEARPDDDAVSFFQRADEALYRAKESGKGQIVNTA